MFDVETSGLALVKRAWSGESGLSLEAVQSSVQFATCLFALQGNR